jgi:hypothetical protein
LTRRRQGPRDSLTPVTEPALRLSYAARVLNPGVSMHFGLRALPVLALSVLLGACAVKPQLPVDLGPEALAPAKQQKVGVAMARMPKPALSLPGANCLLCIVAAQAMNSSLGKHAETLSTEDLAGLKEQIAVALRKKGLTASVIPEDVEVDKLADAPASDAVPNAARKNFGPLKQKFAVDKLVVVQIDQVGIQRNYSAYSPAGDPKAVVRGAGYMVDLSKNTYDWYLPLAVSKAADGNWDEPDKVPGLTNAYYQAIEAGRDSLLQPFGR